jgi:hypothetical protein
MTSRGLETMMKIAFGECATACWAQDATIFAFAASRSSRLMPGFRAKPAVMMTMSELAVGS